MDFSDNYTNFIKKISNINELSLDELKKLWKEADEIESQYDNMQLVVKCDANSLYGVSASIYYSLCDFDIAEDITTTGKLFCVIVDKAINNFFVNWTNNEYLEIIQEFYPNVINLRKFSQYVPDTINDLCVYGDTDSRYIDLEMIYNLLETDNGIMGLPNDDKELSSFGVYIYDKFISKIIKDTIDKECEYRNARKGYLKMNLETITRKSIFQAKKKYIMNVIWADGKHLKTPKLKFMGVELKRGSSSPKSKAILSKLVDKYLLKNYTNAQLRLEILKLTKYIKAKKEKDFVYLISSVSGLDNIKLNENKTRYISDKNHIQMQIALSWVNFIKDNKLEQEYRPPFEGQKMNYYYCKPGGKYKVIGVPDDVDMNTVKNLPDVDWPRMISASIIKPLLRYILENEDIIDAKNKLSDKDVENFLLGIKQWKF